MELEEQAKRATDMLAGKVVSRVVRAHEGEVLVEFEDGTRLFVDRNQTGVEISYHRRDSVEAMVTSRVLVAAYVAILGVLATSGLDFTASIGWFSSRYLALAFVRRR